MKRNQTFHETLIPLLVEGVGAKTYLEFGTHLNETIGKVPCAKRVGVDIFAQDDPSLDEGFYSGPIQFFKMKTQEFIKTHAKENGPYDFVFIDANHSKESVKADFEGIWPFVSMEGLVCLHDGNPETVADTSPGFCGDAWRFISTLNREGYEACTLPYHPGLTIVRKRGIWGPR